jgi:hypothetical protein
MSCQGCSWHLCPRYGVSVNPFEIITSICFSPVPPMNSFGVQILKVWWKSFAVIVREDFPFVRRNLFWNICACWREIRALPSIQTRRSYLLDKSLTEEGFSVTRQLSLFKQGNRQSWVLRALLCAIFTWVFNLSLFVLLYPSTLNIEVYIVNCRIIYCEVNFVG